MGDQRSAPLTSKPSDIQPYTLTVNDSWNIFAAEDNWETDVAELNSAPSAAAGTPEDLPDVDLLAFFRDLPDDHGPCTNIDDGEKSPILSELDQLSPSVDAGVLKTEMPDPRLNTPHVERSEDIGKAGSQVAAPGSSILASGSDSENDLDQHTSVSSAASVSEFSDDGTCNRSSPVSSFLGTPGAGPANRGGACRPSHYPRGDSVSGVKRSANSANLHPRPTAGPSPTLEDPTRMSTQSAQSAVGSVTSGPGAPILPFAFVPSFHCAPQGPVSSERDTNTKAVAPVPMMGSLQAATAFAAASGVANQMLAAGLKRLRGGEASSGLLDVKPAAKEERRRVLLSTTSAVDDKNSGAVGPGNAGDASTRKRTKREERLIKNREAANRSRMKRKEIMSDLEGRVTTLSRSLDESRQENDSLKADLASLREQNSFLRGMLSAVGKGNELPAVLPTTRRVSGARGPVGSGVARSSSATGASAVIGAVGTALTVISCVALSAAGYGEDEVAGSVGSWAEGSRVQVGPPGGAGIKGGRAAGRRMLLSIDDTVPEGAEVGVSQFEFTGSVLQWGGLVLVIVLALVYVVVASSGGYDATRRPRNRTPPSRASFFKGSIYDVWGLIWSSGSAKENDDKLL